MAQLATWEAKTDQRIKAINMNRRLKALQDRREADLDRRRRDLSCKLAAEQQVSSPGSASQPWQAEEVPVVDAVQDMMLNWAIQFVPACSTQSCAGGSCPSFSCLRPEARTSSHHVQPLEALQSGWSDASP